MIGSTQFAITNKTNFTSRNQILNWINSLLKLFITRIETLGSGAIYCQILDSIYPNKVPIQKVNFAAQHEIEFIKNFLILQQCFQNLNIVKNIQIQKLIKAKYQDNLEFAQWMMGFYFSQCTLKEYDALQRRKGLKINFSFSEKTSNYNQNMQIQLPFTDHKSENNLYVSGMFPSGQKQCDDEKIHQINNKRYACSNSILLEKQNESLLQEKDQTKCNKTTIKYETSEDNHMDIEIKENNECHQINQQLLFSPLISEKNHQYQEKKFLTDIKYCINKSYFQIQSAKNQSNQTPKEIFTSENSIFYTSQDNSNLLLSQSIQVVRNQVPLNLTDTSEKKVNFLDQNVQQFYQDELQKNNYKTEIDFQSQYQSQELTTNLQQQFQTNNEQKQTNEFHRFEIYDNQSQNQSTNQSFSNTIEIDEFYTCYSNFQYSNPDEILPLKSTCYNI